MIQQTRISGYSLVTARVLAVQNPQGVLLVALLAIGAKLFTKRLNMV
jgi:hypothetical protein